MARCASAMGFRNVSDLFEQGKRIADGIAAGEPESRADWPRAFLATEIVFISNVVGSGWDWAITAGFADGSTLKTLRTLQRKIVAGGVIGEVFGAGPRR